LTAGAGLTAGAAADAALAGFSGSLAAGFSGSLTAGFSTLAFSSILVFSSTGGAVGAAATGGAGGGGAAGAAAVAGFSSVTPGGREISRREAIGTICPRAAALGACGAGPAEAGFRSGSSIGLLSLPGERNGNSR